MTTGLPRRAPDVHGPTHRSFARLESNAIYNPLPNHLHVPWSIKGGRSWETCPLRKADQPHDRRSHFPLLRTRDRTGVKIEEAFMVRTHPQWRGVLDLIRKGRIGERCGL
jgi:hypothetical protein